MEKKLRKECAMLYRSDREVVRAREKEYRFLNDLLSENALGWCLPKHPHSLHAVEPKCPWCGIERTILAAGHMASIRPSPKWWRDFLEQVRKERDAIVAIHGSIGWATLRISADDGRWWVLNALDFDRPGTPPYFLATDGRLPRYTVGRLRSRASAKARKAARPESSGPDRP